VKRHGMLLAASAGFAALLCVPATTGAAQVITIAPPTLPDGTVGVTYGEFIQASLDALHSTFDFAVTNGALPAGLALTGTPNQIVDGRRVLSGIPAAAGSSTFTIQVTDTNGDLGQISYTLTIVDAVPILPRAFVVLLAVGLTAIGCFRSRRRALTRSVRKDGRPHDRALRDRGVTLSDRLSDR
jgi:hypothetical protein